MTPPQEDRVMTMAKQGFSFFTMLVCVWLMDPATLCAMLLWWIAFIK